MQCQCPTRDWAIKAQFLVFPEKANSYLLRLLEKIKRRFKYLKEENLDDIL